MYSRVKYEYRIDPISSASSHQPLTMKEVLPRLIRDSNIFWLLHDSVLFCSPISKTHEPRRCASLSRSQWSQRKSNMSTPQFDAEKAENNPEIEMQFAVKTVEHLEVSQASMCSSGF